MKYAERKEMMAALDPESLRGGTAKANLAEGHFRYYVLQLLADIADSQGTMAYCYQEMLKLQQRRDGAPRKPNAGQQQAPVPPTDLPVTQKSRYGGPQ